MNQQSISSEEIDRRFDLHRPDDATGQVMDEVRGEFKQLAATIADLVPASREASLSLTKLEESLFHAISALARDDK